jgi:hypothetical protein
MRADRPFDHTRAAHAVGLPRGLRAAAGRCASERALDAAALAPFDGACFKLRAAKEILMHGGSRCVSIKLRQKV